MKPLAIFCSVVTLISLSLGLTSCNNMSSPAMSFTLGGTVVNLAGTRGGLVLVNNGKDALIVNANGSFVFPKAIPMGSSYNVSILAQPVNPSQICGVVNGSGTATTNVMNINVNCGHNEWTWMKGTQVVQQDGIYGSMGVSSASNNPGGRQSPLTWADSSGALWLFGGYGEDSTGTRLPMNDLWKYSAGQWTWVAGPDTGGSKGTYGAIGVAAPGNIPGARFESVSWTDASGDLWLFGGEGYDSTGNNASLDDMWRYSGGEWTWMGGPSLANQIGMYGTMGAPSPSNFPGSRFQALSWVDSSGNFWLFGGFGYDSAGTNGVLNDLWKYAGGEWTWMSGSKLANQHSVYGTEGVSAPSNMPGGRNWATGWIDSSGALWVFGGASYSAAGLSGMLNDLWKYSGGEWTWMGGSNATNQMGTYGLPGVSAMSNAPGARQDAIGWTDSHGCIWLFGGNGNDSAGGTGLLNDLWKYSNGRWTWVSGSKLINQNGMYGAQGAIAPGNIPGARFVVNRWIDANGNLWLFGGYGIASGTEGDLNDLWMYMP